MPESSHPVETMVMISRSIRLAKFQDGTILLDLEQGVMFSLNPVGARVMELLTAERDLSSLIETIGREFHVSPEIVKVDVAEFLATLQQQRMLRVGDAGDGPERGGAR